ncbi:MAG: endolytic transglycosylase MltG [Candidatus Roizmanbacteria bacterium]|nr:endolytic transglycosylase MltG [Candidatus Roizmanbacteria bacterium]
MKKSFVFYLFCLFVPIFLYWLIFGPVGSSKESLFIVPQNQEGFNIVQKLEEGKFIKNRMVFELFKNTFLLHITIEPGGYQLNENMWAWNVLSKLNGKPDLVWVRFGGCLRKEQIGEILAGSLGWSSDELNKWNTQYTNTKPEYFEGVYYPDTYLIPVHESGDKIAQRLINRFNEKFNPLANKYIQANIRWVTGLKIASLIAREAAGKQDMHLISGIIWNRLDIGMPLQIDSTMQYTLGKNSEGKWWGGIDINEKQNDSPYNSYLYKGLPPTPICSPNIDYIEAALNPEETDCLFYLHDSKEQIHCAKTYEQHLKNIETYLN